MANHLPSGRGRTLLPYLALSFAGFIGATPWTGVLDPSRALDWSTAGSGPIPTNRTQCGATIGAYSGTADAINGALAACGPDQYVLLGPGTFHLSDGVTFDGKGNLTLRGSGADKTSLVFSGSNSCGGAPSGLICVWNNDGNYSGGPTHTADWTTGYDAGSTTITLSSTASLRVGSLLYLDQLNDTYQFSDAKCSAGIVTATVGANSLSLTHGKPIATIQGVNPSGYNSPSGGGSYPVTAVTSTTVSYDLGGACPGSYVSGGTATLDDGALTISNDGTFSSFHAQGNNPGRGSNDCSPAGGGYGCRSAAQAVIVTGCGTTTAGAACTGNTVTLSSGVYDRHIRTDRAPGAWWGNSLPITGVGVEDMSIDSSNASAGGIVSFNNAAYSWVKGLRTMDAASSHHLLWQTSHITVRDSYMYGNQGHGATSSQSYCTDTYSASSDNLIENNIYQHCAVGMQNEGGMGNVYGYNYSIDNDNPPETDWPLHDASQHAPGTEFNLWEGNVILGVALDDFHGNGYAPTFFRNRMKGWEAGKDTQTAAINVQTGYRQTNIVGNILGTAGYHKNYEWIEGTNAGSSDEAQCSVSVIVTGFGGNCDSRIATDNCDTNTREIDDSQVNPPDAANPGTTMLWGNYDVVHAAVRFEATEVPSKLPIYANPVPASHALASSWYEADYGAFWTTPWGTPPYPPIGPDVAGGDIPNLGGYANGLPAQLCFQNSPVDPAYSVQSPVTSAIWSSGTATITIGSQAASMDTGSVVIVSGMTPSGYDCSDRTVCQISATTATSVSYPLATDPGPFTGTSGGTATTPAVLAFNASNCYARDANAPDGGTGFDGGSSADGGDSTQDGGGSHGVDGGDGGGGGGGTTPGNGSGRSGGGCAVGGRGSSGAGLWAALGALVLALRWRRGRRARAR